VAEALATLLEGTGFSYRPGSHEVILAPTTRAPRTPTATGPAAAPPTEPAPAADPPEQQAVLTGTVTATTGAPVPDASVRLVRARVATVTDAAGRYRLIVPGPRLAPGPDTLRVDRIGYASTATPVELRPGELRVDVRLALQAVPLDQIVVTGTAGNQQRRAQAAVVASIDAADLLARSPVTNVSQLLEARLPGISVTQSSGTTGAGSRITIRGAASISLSNQPLVFIDGVRAEGGPRSLVNVSGGATVGQAPSALDDLNPDDIERIEIVKGPAAATLYGADASAGVIQIITKRGRLGRSGFSQDVALEYGTVDPAFTVPTNYARCTAALVQPNSPNPLCRGQPEGTVISDNPARRIGAFRDGWLGSFRYSARGGGENFGYFLSASLADEQGTTRNNTLKQRTGRANVTFAPTERLAFDAAFAISRTEYDLPRSDQDAYGYYVQSILGSPLTVREGPDGSLTGGLLFASSSLESLSAITSRASALRLTPSLQIRYAPRPWLTHQLTLGADLTEATGFQHFPKNDLGWYPDRLASGNGDVTHTREDDRSYTVDYLGNLRASFGREGEFSSNLSFGSQYIHRVNNRLSAFGAGLVSNDAVLVTNAALSTVGQGYAESRALGLFLQEQIGYRDRIFLQLGLRADRNSAFGEEVGTFYLPKIGASYVISDEPFWRPLAGTIPTLRLRAAYGTTGRSPAAGTSLRTYATGRYVTDAGALELGIVPANPGNPDLRPERGKELEAGLDAGFLGDRLGIELTFFEKRSTDLLVSVPIAPSSGFPSGPLANLGEVTNRGIELLARATPVNRRALVWDIALNANTLHNEILDLGTAGTFINNFRAFVPGRQIAAWWVHRVRRVDTASGRAIVSDTAEFAGNQLPTLQGSLASTLTLLRNLRIYALLEAKSGYRVYNLNQEFRDRSARSSAQVNLPPEQGGYPPEERIRRLGPYTAETTGQPVGVGNVKEPYLQKGDHIRFRELSITLTLPTTLARRAGARAATLLLGGRNLALWAPHYEGHDPEVLGVGAQPTGLSQLFQADVFTTPPARRWIARLNLQF
ncbi:MAG TPA: SusC/RagA family TonB-linked outer membrane protein, partial [Gemmatimonadales bacterium]|nr:SusC/RagA family TonB-linked outer membrane protein [Gemmatimonadales bacterium]